MREYVDTLAVNSAYLPDNTDHEQCKISEQFPSNAALQFLDALILRSPPRNPCQRG